MRRWTILPFVDNNERPDKQFRFWLNSGRGVEHFHTRTRTGKIGNVNKFSPTPVHGDEPGFGKRAGHRPHQGLAFIEAPGGGSADSGGCGTGCGCSVPAPAFKRRENEPAYALLPPSNGASLNQHGKSIRLADDGSPLAGQRRLVAGIALVTTLALMRVDGVPGFWAWLLAALMIIGTALSTCW